MGDDSDALVESFQISAEELAGVMRAIRLALEDQGKLKIGVGAGAAPYVREALDNAGFEHIQFDTLG